TTRTFGASAGRWVDHAGVRWLLALLFASAGVVPPLLGRVIPDTAFLLYAAERLLDGARLYVDLVEVNPPLVVWLNLPLVILARVLGVSPVPVYQIAVAVLAGFSLATARLILRRALPPDAADLRRTLM